MWPLYALKSNRTLVRITALSCWNTSHPNRGAQAIELWGAGGMPSAAAGGGYGGGGGPAPPGNDVHTVTGAGELSLSV